MENIHRKNQHLKLFFHWQKSLPFVTKGYIYVINQMLAQNKIEILLFLYVKKKKAVIQQPSSRYKMYIYFYSA